MSKPRMPTLLSLLLALSALTACKEGDVMFDDGGFDFDDGGPSAGGSGAAGNGAGGIL